jgi:Phage integrase, N-terminal SAM-like domain
MSSSQPASAGRQLPRGHLLARNRSFRRTLEAENKNPRTIEAYTDAVRLLATHCQAHGHPVLAGELQRAHIQACIADQLARWKPATAHNRYRGLHAFSKWAVAEGDLQASPMDGMRPPQPPSSRSRWSGLGTWPGCSGPARGATSPAAATPPPFCSWSTPACAGPSASA